MALFKCKMCGGTLEVTSGATVMECEYCGTQQTLPKLDDDRRANLYDRANHFRRNNEFDKAMGIYEQILNEDTADAEAYWSLVLCRYGIEYVEDPSTHKRIPTVNRAQFTSVFDDDNYRSALQYADSYQRRLYEAEAKTINEIQKGILSISQKEEPFDVFICYKETDNHGRRTPDSVLANDLYHQLTQEGFKVFFARITLEDKLGSAYEPYIFAALNSAKVMVVLGTKPEYFKAVWVRNEWSRYLSLIKQGQKKILIPAYKDMDPYDLPDEFSHLQAQDMSKLGFMQDLIRGIKKITRSADRFNIKGQNIESAGSRINTNPLIKRVFMFLEDGNWTSADEYCEKVLDMDPESAEAYLGKLMVELRVPKEEQLKDCAVPFDCNKNYHKVIRFADDKLKNTLKEYNDHINVRNENQRLEGIYIQSRTIMNSATTDSHFMEAASIFDSILQYKDSSDLAIECRKKAEECLEKAQNAKKDAILAHAKALLEDAKSKTYVSLYERIANFERAVKLYSSISGWKDADQDAIVCEDYIKILNIERTEEESQNKRKKKTVNILLLIISLFFLAFLISNSFIIPNQRYNKALSLVDAGKYDEAMILFKDLGDYKDSEEKFVESRYLSAVALMDSGKYDEAISIFEDLDSYKDSEDKIVESRYLSAVVLMDSGKYDEAISIFEDLGSYKDSKYNIALSHMKAERYYEAFLGFWDLGDYKDSAKLKEECEFKMVFSMMG